MAIAVKRIDIRASKNDKSLLTSAAKSKGMTLSQFVLDVTLKEAHHILADQPQIRLSSAQWEEFVNRLDHPRCNVSSVKKLMQTPSVFTDA